MKSITLHNLDDKLVALIEKKSKATGKSLNKTIKELVRQALGITKDVSDVKREEFSEFFGIWTQEDFLEFQDNVLDFEKVDPADWQ